MLVYASRTGNVKSVIEKMLTQLEDTQVLKITPELTVSEPYILFTYTDGLGSIPKQVDDFLERNYQLCLGVFASGNRNFGLNHFAGSADKINTKYGIPVLHKIELRGYPSDIEKMVGIYKERVMINGK